MAVNPTFLIVEDDDAVRHVLERAVRLAHPNATVLETGTVAEAIQTLDHFAVGAVVTDGELPDGTGLEVLAASRQRDPTRHVLLWSADARFAQPALAGGASAFLDKPIDLSELLRHLRQLL